MVLQPALLLEPTDRGRQKSHRPAHAVLITAMRGHHHPAPDEETQETVTSSCEWQSRNLLKPSNLGTPNL